MTTLTREQLRQRIDLLEALQSVMGAIDDFSGAELKAGELVDLQIGDREHQVICTGHALPQEVVLAGLQAMREALVRIGGAS